MRIIAVRGNDQFIIVEDDVDETDPAAEGQLLDLAARKLSAPTLIQSLLRSGYWEPAVGDDGLIRSLMQVGEVEKF